MIPPVFVNAVVRGILPVCKQTGRMGMSFTLADGSIMRIAMPQEDAERFAVWIQSCLERCGVQSEMSSDMPKADVSPVEGQ